MKFPFFGRKKPVSKDEPITIPALSFDEDTDAENYIADDGLKTAINLALLMGKPLLITGEPGTGKTQSAYRLGWELGYEVHRFNTKSTSTAKDLFYTFDTFTRFQDIYSIQNKNNTTSKEKIEYITFNALGLAIINGIDKKDLSGKIPDKFILDAPKRSIVLIDEIDKAPRDFPNDILNEVEAFAFKISEINKEFTVNPAFAPIIIITSNSEKNLPHAFLRRCMFHHIDFPSKEKLEEIVTQRLSIFIDKSSKNEKDEIISTAIQVFTQIRNLALTRKPSTAELILWIKTMLNEDFRKEKSKKQLYLTSLGCIIKDANDKTKATQLINNYFN